MARQDRRTANKHLAGLLNQINPTWDEQRTYLRLDELSTTPLPDLARHAITTATSRTSQPTDINPRTPNPISTTPNNPATPERIRAIREQQTRARTEDDGARPAFDGDRAREGDPVATPDDVRETWIMISAATSDDGTEYKHDHGLGDGDGYPECPACWAGYPECPAWAASIRQALGDRNPDA